MANLREHLRVSKRFLGINGNPVIHRLLDGAGLPHKLRSTYHKVTHEPVYIETMIRPLFGEKGVLEAWSHLLTDWGFIPASYGIRKKRHI